MLLVFVIAFMNGGFEPGFAAAEPETPPEATQENLALGKEATSSSNEIPEFHAGQAVDGKMGAYSRWSSGRTDNEWWMVDLGEVKTVGKVSINWRTPAETFRIMLSEDGKNWTNALPKGQTLSAPQRASEAEGVVQVIQFQQQSAKYVKFEGVKQRAVEGIQYGYSFWEFEVYEGEAGEVPQPEKPENLAFGKQASASSIEDPIFPPSKAVDGHIGDGSRWSSARTDNEWWMVDLGEAMPVGKVVIHWQTPAEKYKIMLSTDGQNWVNALPNDQVITADPAKDVIGFAQHSARYVKFQGVERRPYEGIIYGYSFWEFEVYAEKDALPQVMEEIKNGLSVTPGQTQLVFPAVRDGYEVTLVGSDRKPVIDLNGNIHTPLVDADVNLLIEVKSATDPALKLQDNVLVTVPGQHGAMGKAPRVIPSLQEWVGAEGQFTLTGQSRIVVKAADQTALQQTANILKQDLQALTNLSLPITYGAPQAGDIYLTLDAGQAALGKEGYLLEIKDSVSIAASDNTGVFYGTRTILQLLDHDAEHLHLSKAVVRDYPKYEDRGFMLDVARKFYTIDFLRDYVKIMSYYKMNRFQIHLNDDVGTPLSDGKRAAFRLESEKFPGLTSKDGYYTKAEFRDLQKLGMEYGVNVVPEIDTPGHSGVFIDYDPSLGKNKMLDVTRPETVQFVKDLFDEYLTGDNPTFIGPDVNIGADEYIGDKEAFRAYMDTMINFINDHGKRPRLWGVLTKYDGTTPISNQATMDIWYEEDGRASQAAELGYDIINTNTNLLYVVPQLYRSYLNYEYIYNTWEPNMWDNNKLPLGHPRVKGSMFAFWNDVSIEKGVSMADSHARIVPSMQFLSEKLWAGTRADRDYASFEADAAKYNDPPNVDLSHKVEANNDDHKVISYNFEDGIKDGSGNGFDGTAHNVELTSSIFGTGAKLKGGSSYIETPLRSLGFGWTFSMWIKPDADNAGNAVLLESPEGKLIYNIDNSGKIGFTKENYKSVFDYKISADKWTHIVLTGDNTGTSIFVNGSEFITTLKEGTKLDTFILPMARIGSETNGFKGMIDEVEVRNTHLDLHGNLALHKHAESSEPESATLTADKAVDGRGDTRWSSAWVDDTWFLVDLGEPMEIDKIAISWQGAYATKYRILVSEDKEKWINVTATNNGVIEGKGGREIIKFPNTMARYVKFEGISRATIFGYSFEEFEVFSEKNQLGNKRTVIDLLTAIEEAKFDPAKYSKEVWQALQDAIAAAASGINQLSVSKPELAALLNPLNKSFDVIAVEDAFAALKLENTEGAVANIRLPHKGLHDTRISWSTSDAAYINENGQLMKRPAAGQSDASLVLTATITKGEVTKTKEFKVTVKSLSDGSTWYPGPVVIPPVTNPGDQGNGGDSETGAETGTGTETGAETEGPGNDGTVVTLKDITGHWAEGAIKQAAELGIVTGNTAGLFQPDKPISRDEFIAMLVRALKLEGAGSELSFRDNKDIQAWARLAIAQAVQAGLVTGYSDQTFRPKALISRAEMAAIIIRSMGIEPAPSAKLPFKDAAQIPQWAKSYVAAAYETGIMSGRTQQTFVPEAQASRAEAVVVILRMLNKQ